MANYQSGGAFLPGGDYNTTGEWKFDGTETHTGSVTFSGTVAMTGTNSSTSQTITNPTINGTAFTTGQTVSIIEKVALSGATIHAGVVTAKTFSAAAIILRVVLDITTQSSGASTIDIGYTAVSATTASDTLLDGVSGAAVAMFDSMNALLDSGANANAQKAASGKWITVKEASGDTTGLVGNLYIEYCLI